MVCWFVKADQFIFKTIIIILHSLRKGAENEKSKSIGHAHSISLYIKPIFGGGGNRDMLWHMEVGGGAGVGVQTCL